MLGKKHLTFLAFMIFFLLLLVRIIHLSADPPYDLSTSGGPYGDPGGYSFNARNKILFGKWEVDNYNMMYLSFPPHLVTYLSFKILGIGFAQQNLVPVLFSLGSLIVFFLILHDRFSPPWALCGTSLLGFNYLFLMYSRVANRIMPPLFFILLGIYFLQKKKHPVWMPIASGFSFFLAFASKSVVFYILVAVYAAFLLHGLFRASIQKIATRTGLLITGALIPGVPWLYFIYLPHQDFIHSFSRLNVPLLIPPADLSLIIRYFWTRPSILLEHMPFLCILAALGALVLLYISIQNPKKASLTDFIFLLWFITGSLYYAVIQQRVTRTFIPQIIPLVFLVIVLGHQWLAPPNHKNQKPHWIFGLFLFLWLLFPVSLVLKYLESRYPPLFRGQKSVNLTLIILCLIMTLAVWLVLKAWPKPRIRNHFLPWKKSMAWLFLSAVLILQGTSYLGWALHPRFQFKNASKDLGKIFADASIAGLWAPVICLENRHRAHEYYQGYINDYPDFFQRFAITHVFTTTAYGEKQIFQTNFPQVMATAQLLARYHIWTVEALLYQVRPEKEATERGLYEAELFTQRGNTPRFDSQASQKWAVLSLSKHARFVVVIPGETSYGAGFYTVTFRMRKQGPLRDPEKRMARIDVISPERKRRLVHRDIYSQDFKTGGYQDFQLAVPLNRPQKMIFRVYSQGNGSIWVDKIHVNKVGLTQ